jgi:hypothetical protein
MMPRGDTGYHCIHRSHHQSVIGRMASGIDTSWTCRFCIYSNRSAVSTNGVDLWVTRARAASVIRHRIAATTRLTAVAVFEMGQLKSTRQLYVTTGAGTTIAWAQSAGLPTAAGQTATNLPGFLTSGSPNILCRLRCWCRWIRYVIRGGRRWHRSKILAGRWKLDGQWHDNANWRSWLNRRS